MLTQTEAKRIGKAVANAYAKASIQRAIEAATRAAKETTPKPMTLRDTRTGQRFYETDGACGFGYVTINPARGPLVSELKKAKLGHKGYPRGYEISMSRFVNLSQSVERAEAAAKAFAEVLQKDGFHGVSYYSRLD